MWDLKREHRGSLIDSFIYSLVAIFCRVTILGPYCAQRRPALTWP